MNQTRPTLTCAGCHTVFPQRLIEPEPGWEDDNDFCDECNATIERKLATQSDRDKLMERVEAVKAWGQTHRGLTREAEVLAFLDIFHPALYQNTKKREAIQRAILRPQERVG